MDINWDIVDNKTGLFSLEGQEHRAKVVDVYDGDDCFHPIAYELSPNKKISRNGLLISSGFEYDKFNIEITLFNFKKEKWEQESPTYNSMYPFSDKTSYLRLSIGYCFMF